MSSLYICPYCGCHSQYHQRATAQSPFCPGCGQTITLGKGGQFRTPAVDGGAIAALFGTALRWVFLSALVLIVFAVLIGMLLPVMTSHGTAHRASCISRLKNISLAMWNYMEMHQEFPPAYTADEQGRPLHSWRTLILPYMEEGPLYHQIDRTEAWDGPKNRLLAETELPIYKCPSVEFSEPGMTSYMVVTGPGTMFDGPNGKTPGRIFDGLANTATIVEVPGRQVPWMQPQDIDEKTFLDLFRGGEFAHSGGINMAFCDGHVLFVSGRVSQQTIHALLTPNGKEPIPESFLGR